jgi:hypothetical protein
MEEPTPAGEPALLVDAIIVYHRGVFPAQRKAEDEKALVPEIAVRIIPAPIVIIAAANSRIPQIGTTGFIVEADGGIVVCSHPAVPCPPPPVIVNVRILKRRVGRASPQEESKEQNAQRANRPKAAGSHSPDPFHKVLVQV